VELSFNLGEIVFQLYLQASFPRCTSSPLLLYLQGSIPSLMPLPSTVCTSALRLRAARPQLRSFLPPHACA